MIERGERMAAETGVLCQLARQRHRSAALWLNLWTILIWVFGVAVVAFLVVAIVMFLREEWLAGALTALAWIAEGAAIKWVRDRRTEAVSEEKLAYQDVQQACPETTTADQLREKLRLLGRVI
jgi:hypothetical protein